ncbi:MULTISPECIES: DotU family type IV/VI secretion system protein [Cysteiniphilum]|uniref:Type IV / VI secretion system DotU domain-containing protein n=1 Tax=Cysteiniphilum litorale TaxID=2056700 RepID=A0A8J3E7B2_9GAMM|nr:MULTISPECIES: DotU family type IV/VI secretion system protein [Cysteiniphilum]GGF90988.1 hypothetical protein GCM10010995_05350 [Cysteiniphilum litorale]
MNHLNYWSLWLDVMRKLDELQQEFKNQLQPELIITKLSQVRDEMVEAISHLRRLVAETYQDDVEFYVIFPLACYCDEQINVNLEKLLDSHKWHSLQNHYYQRVDGGVYFFSMIDDVLSGAKKVPEFIVLSMILLLKAGFKGKYYLTNQHGTKFYIDKLSKYLNDSCISRKTNSYLKLQDKLQDNPLREQGISGRLRYMHILKHLNYRFAYGFLGASLLTLLTTYGYLWWC